MNSSIQLLVFDQKVVRLHDGENTKRNTTKKLKKIITIRLLNFRVKSLESDLNVKFKRRGKYIPFLEPVKLS